jgi:menaquinone-dependent protoporphyrinogen oxidase
MTERVLVAYASKEGSTAEIAEAVAATLREQGLYAETREATEVRDLEGYDAVVVGSAVYAFHWRSEAVRLLRKNAKQLAGRPVWLFQSGPLDTSAEEKDLALPHKVKKLATKIGIRGYQTFGGKVSPDAKSFLARKMTNGEVRDMRNFDQIHTWAKGVAADVPVVAA